MKAPTLQTIADHLGLSRNTVSCALRNQGRIAAATRERVQKAAEALGYRPNPLVSALMHARRSGRTPARIANLAFLHNYSTRESWRNFPHCVEMLEGAERRASELGFTLAPFWADPRSTPDSLTRILLNRGVVGIVVPPLTSFCPPPALEWDRFAATAIGHSLKDPKLHMVGTLFLKLIPIAVDGLKSLGYRRIGVLLSPKSNARVDFGWEAGYAIAKRQTNSSTRLSLHLLRQRLAKAETLDRWIKKTQIEAIIIAGTDGVQEELSALKLSIPEDIGLVNILAEGGDLATVLREHHAIGRIAVESTVKQLLHNERGVPRLRQMILVDGVWEPRGSVRRIHN